jgi:phospholipid transport system substrate-binding protein
MNIKLLTVLAVLVCFVLAGSGKARASVTDEVKKTVDEVVRIVSDKELKKAQNEKKKRKALKAIIGTLFDYTEMTKRAIGGHWKELSAPDKKEITGLFETLLENSYANKIESYNNEKVIYLREDTEDNYSEVKTKIVTVKRDEYAVDYRLMNKDGRWMVYDVVIEGVSLVSNYRTQFNKIINNQGFKELLKKLRAKNSAEIKPI